MTPPILGEAPRALSRGSRLWDLGSAAGPASYAAGGFNITTDLTALDGVMVAARNSQILAAADTVYEVRYSVTGGVINIQVFTASTVGAGPNAWAQIADTTDLSGVTFDYLALGRAA